ncbi:hypothetical protein Tco_0318426 [Tanacetum coccineum]
METYSPPSTVSTDDDEDLQLHTTSNFKADHVDAYDLDCDDEATASAIFMASLSPAGSVNGDTVETEYIEHIVSNNDTCDELMSDSNVISYADYMVTIENDVAQYVSPPEQNKDAMILSVIEQMKGQVDLCNTVNKEAKSMNKSLSIIVDRNQKVEAFESQFVVQRQQIENLIQINNSLKNDFEKHKIESSKKYEKNFSDIVDLENAKKKLENIVYKVGQTTQTMHMLTKPQRFYDNTRKTALGYQNPLYLTQAQRLQPVLYNAKALSEKHDPISVYDSEDTLITAKESRLKIKEKQEKHNDKPIDYSKLNKLYEYFVPKKQLSVEQVYWAPVSAPLPSVDNPTPPKFFLNNFQQKVW